MFSHQPTPLTSAKRFFFGSTLGLADILRDGMHQSSRIVERGGTHDMKGGSLIDSLTNCEVEFGLMA